MYCGSQLVWMRAENGDVPPGAVSAGTTCDGEEAFVGRARLGPCGEDIIIGKVLPSQGACFVPFNGKEEAKTDYEVLVLVQ
ncbi:uncharacterized protein LOC113384861 [Ctenocephalides felis]|uniref:uncharacterized protein LOC113384861 n=1 Tax=Ctenocephalides felis TaxID=7515 RepID=UPI000E6E174A|nr:uncharacterized protein LOC113384861 [Ctenocephalides felis]